jgi:hypothetical protein
MHDVVDSFSKYCITVADVSIGYAYTYSNRLVIDVYLHGIYEQNMHNICIESMFFKIIYCVNIHIFCKYI